MNQPIVYVIEDNIELAAVWRRALEAVAMRIHHFPDLASSQASLERTRPDLCLIDLGLPDGDGLELLRRRLGVDAIPTIVVSGRGSLDDRLQGLELGADDYLTKPVEPAELVARVRSLLRRSRNAAIGTRPAASDGGGGTANEENVARFGDWTCDFGSYRLAETGGAEHVLSRADAELLHVFLSSPGRVVTRDRLLELLHAHGEEPFDRSVDVRVSRLRKKLGDDPKRPNHIRTVYGAGYVFASPVRWSAS